jgi:hypothetical protein
MAPRDQVTIDDALEAFLAEQGGCLAAKRCVAIRM